jgi:hypothetical protein
MKRRMMCWKKTVRITMVSSLRNYLLHHLLHRRHRCPQKAGSTKQLSASARIRGRNCLPYRSRMKSVRTQ